jgi:phosphoglycolate phosphatase-like HAD superfamily hydrolase
MKLLLFDIDGTLLHANGTGRTAVEKALTDLCGRSISTDGVTFSGKTDPAIMREILEANGLDPADTLVRDALDVYEETAHAAFDPDTVDALPGTTALLDRLAPRQEVHLGLLTGNIESMAYRKLNAVDFDHHFAFGAFGSDHSERHHLPPVAVARALAHTGHQFRGADVVIIGDTQHDIHCGRHVGALSVAVCTGRYARGELAAHEPDVLLDDLSDAEGFVNAILG